LLFAFEGHINVGQGPHPTLGPPVGPPWSRVIDIVVWKISFMAEAVIVET